jgi:PKHD-type hydroxylase
MDNNYFIQNILTKSDILYLKSILYSDTVGWKNGMSSTINGNNKIKNNLELDDKCNLRYQISDSIIKKFYENHNFSKYCIPFKSYPAIISKTVKGGFYKPHEDSGFLGDYSTTLFISDPSEYGGGELVLYIDGEEKIFKLDSGVSITYNTGIPHQVKTVTSGERIVSVFWTHSRFNDPSIRKIYSDILSLIDIMDEKTFGKEYNNGLEFDTNFENCTKHPKFILNNIKHNIARRFSIVEQ